jgi:hypothetical protein
MSKINFFDKDCQEDTRNDKRFGLCDDQDGSKAYTDTTDDSKWVATVKNDNSRAVLFTAIDECVIKRNEQTGRGRCDGMLTTSEHLFFVELKDQRQSWISDAIVQLESTVQFFIEHHSIDIYKHKKAFACNKKHPRFSEVDNETNLRFFRTYSFRLDIQAEIIVV